MPLTTLARFPASRIVGCSQYSPELIRREAMVVGEEIQLCLRSHALPQLAGIGFRSRTLRAVSTIYLKNHETFCSGGTVVLPRLRSLNKSRHEPYLAQVHQAISAIQGIDTTVIFLDNPYQLFYDRETL